MKINPELLRQARQKIAFVSAGDPAMGGGAPPGAPPTDPSMGGAPPMDPAMGGAPPMDPSMMGGAPPMDPAMGGAPPGGGQDPFAVLGPMIQQAVQQAMASSGGAQGAPAGIKPKIDVNVEIMQIKKMLAKIIDAMGIHVPVSDMVATPEDLNQIAAGGAGLAAATPDGGGGLGQIVPPKPIKAAEAWEAGVAFTPPASHVFHQAHAATKTAADTATALLLRKRVR